MNETSVRRTAGNGSHSAARNPLLWILGMLCVAAAFGVAYWAFVLTATGQQADNNALRGAIAYLDADTARRPALALLGELPTVSAGIGLLALALAAAVRRSLFAPAVAALAFGAAVLSSQVLKLVVLDRPDKDISEATVNSFPSGHSTFAAASMVAVFLVTSPRWRPLVATGGGLYAALAGSATFVLGWHRPADILAAYLLAVFWGLLGGLVILRRQASWNVWRGSSDHWASARAWVAVLWIPGVVSLGGAAAAYWFVAHARGETGTEGLGWYLVAGVLLIVGSALFLFGLGSAFFSNQTRAPQTTRRRPQR
jgi:membrane-associated phospholipid phosphatase